MLLRSEQTGQINSPVWSGNVHVSIDLQISESCHGCCQIETKYKTNENATNNEWVVEMERKGKGGKRVCSRPVVVVVLVYQSNGETRETLLSAVRGQVSGTEFFPLQDIIKHDSPFEITAPPPFLKRSAGTGKPTLMPSPQMRPTSLLIVDKRLPTYTQHTSSA